MPKKKKGQGEKDSAEKRTLNAPGHEPQSTREPYEQDVKRRIGQHTGAGEPPIMKK